MAALGRDLPSDASSVERKSAAAELAHQYVRMHEHRMKFFVLKNNLLVPVMNLLGARSQHAKLAALRVLRACVSYKDEFLTKHIIRTDLFKVRSSEGGGREREEEVR